MRRLVSLICMVAALLSAPGSASAGDIPESLLHDDNAQLFFARVVSYRPDGEHSEVLLSPVRVIKGDVQTGGTLAYRWPNTIGDFTVRPGSVYLFTHFNEHNPTDIFEVTSYDTARLRLRNVEGPMWERFQRYLNEGRYEEAERQRLDRQNGLLPLAGDGIPFVELLGVPREEAQRVHLHRSGEFHQVDVDEFYRAIDGVLLDDIEDIPLEGRDDGTIPSGLFIRVGGLRGRTEGHAFITDDCKVDRYGLHHSRLPVGAYTMRAADRARIVALLADEELPDIGGPAIGWTLPAALIAAAVLAVVVAAGRAARRRKD